MGDIVKIFADIGEIYQKDEKRLKNEAYKYDTIKVYLCDIETKQIEPNLNINKDDLIICRFGVGANSGNLFPNSQFLSKEVNKDEAKFIKGILRSVSNLLWQNLQNPFNFYYGNNRSPVQAWQAKWKICAQPELINLILDAGVGSGCMNCGAGFVEIAKEKQVK